MAKKSTSTQTVEKVEAGEKKAAVETVMARIEENAARALLCVSVRMRQ